jgi:MFS family permease
MPAADLTNPSDDQQAVGRRGGSALLIAGLATGVMTLSLLQTLVVPVLSTIAEQLDTSLSAVGWVLTANLLSAAVATPVLGRMGDVYGKRPVMLAILSVVLLGTVLALFTSSLPVLIIARVMQGTSYGLFPLSMGVLRDEVPAERLTMAMAVVSATLGVGGVIGLLATGLLTRHNGDYHHSFWVGLAITLVSLVICWFTLPAAKPVSGSTSVDWVGAAILSVGLVLLLLPISQGEEWGWGSVRTIGSFVASALVLVGWVVAEGRIAQPLARPSLLARRGVMIPNLAALCIGFGLFTSFLGVTGFVESPTALTGYGFTATVLSASAVYLLPGAVLGVVLAPFIGGFVQRVGPYRALLVGAGLGFVGFGGLAFRHDSTWEFIVLGAFMQVAVTFGFATLPALMVQAVEPADTGVANSVNSIARSVGSAVASALTVALLTADLDKGTGLPAESAYVLILALGAVAFALVLLVGSIGLRISRSTPHRPDAHAEQEEAAALAGEFAPAPGIG